MNKQDRQTLRKLNRRTYKETDDFRIWLEDINNQLVVHVIIFNPTPSVLKEIKQSWAQLMIDCYFEGYEDVFTYTKDNRIIKYIGSATMVGQAEDYEVWKWELN